MTDKTQTPSDQQCCEVPLVEQLRSIPSDYRTVRAIQWAEDGTETGHQFIPVGHMMHRAASEIESLKRELAEANQRASDAHRSAVEAAAKVCDNEANEYRESMKACELAGNRHGASADLHGQLAAEMCAKAIRALVESGKAVIAEIKKAAPYYLNETEQRILKRALINSSTLVDGTATAQAELPEPETFRYGLSSLMVRKSDYDTLRSAAERMREEFEKRDAERIKRWSVSVAIQQERAEKAEQQAERLRGELGEARGFLERIHHTALKTYEDRGHHCSHRVHLEAIEQSAKSAIAAIAAAKERA